MIIIINVLSQTYGQNVVIKRNKCEINWAVHNSNFSAQKTVKQLLREQREVLKNHEPQGQSIKHFF